jgi:hypothetical protein
MRDDQRQSPRGGMRGEPRAIAYAGLPDLSRVPLTLILARRRERGRSGDTGFPLPHVWEGLPDLSRVPLTRVTSRRWLELRVA